MRKIATVIAATGMAVAVSASPGIGATISASDITDGQASYTAPGSAVTLSASRGGSPTSLGFAGSTFGVTGGKQANLVDDQDGLPGGSDQEVLHMAFESTNGLASISFQWTRAASEGAIRLTGFVDDPRAAITANPNGNISVNYDSGSNELSIIHPWQGGNVSTVSLANLGASQGQTIELSVDQADSAGPQAGIHEIGYAIPEPASLALLGLGGALLVGRRRNA
jgi:hypothetical protein